MKKLFMVLAVLGMTQFAFASKTFDVVSKKSKLHWVGTKVTGKHEGVINVKKGKIVLDDNNVLTGAEFTVDMTSINVTDLSGEWKQKLEGHLKNDDFFSVDKHKEAKLKLKKVISKSGDTYEVLSDLTIKNVTKEVKFKVTITTKGELTAKGKLVFNRTKYGIKYGSGSFFKGLGDKMIHDDVSLNFNVVAKK